MLVVINYIYYNVVIQNQRLILQYMAILKAQQGKKLDYTGLAKGYVSTPKYEGDKIAQKRYSQPISIKQQLADPRFQEELKNVTMALTINSIAPAAGRPVNAITKSTRTLRNEAVKKELINSMDNDHYYLMHQTDKKGATGIATNGFNIGSGFKGTTLHASPESLSKAIDDVVAGHGHKGSTNVVVMKFPKKEFPYNRAAGEDSFSYTLMERGMDEGTYIGKLPQQYIHGIFNVGGKLSGLLK